MPSRALLALATVFAVGCLAGLWWFTSHGPAQGTVARPSAGHTPGDAPNPGPSAELAASGRSSASSDDDRTSTTRTSLAAKSEPTDDAREVRGKVVFPPGTPLDEEAWVVAKNGTEEQPTRVRVQPDGTFRIAFPARTRRTRLGIEARYLYMRSVGVDFTDTNAPTPVLEPTLGGRLVGRVLTPASPLVTTSRLADVQVWLVGVPHQIEFGDVESMLTRRFAPLDSELAFTFDGLPLGATYSISCDPGFLPVASLADLRIEAGAELRLELQLEDAVRLAGTVLDATGAPVADATVRSSHPARGVRTDGRSQQTAEDGRFELLGVGVGPLAIEVEHERFLTAELDLGLLRSGDDRDDLVIVLESGRAIAGRVTWPDERAVAGAWVSISCVDDLGDRELDPFAFDAFGNGDAPRVKADEEGRFTFAGLEGRTYALAAWAEPDAALLGLDPADPHGRRELHRLNSPPWRGRIPRVQVGPQDLSVVLREGVVLTGTVSDDLGAPIERFFVTARHVADPGAQDPTTEEIRWSFRSDTGQFRLGGLRAGSFDVFVSASRYPTSRPQRLQLGESGADLSAVLLRPASLSGTVVDASGTGIAGAAVECTPLVEIDADLEMISRGRTDDEGRFEVAYVDPRGVRVVASLDGRSPSKPLDLELAPGEERTGLRLVLREGATLTGLVLQSDGRPSPQRSVSITCHAIDFETKTVTDAQGEFTVAGLPPGTYDLRTQPGSTASDLRGADGQMDWKKYRAAAPSAVVAVPATGTVHVVIGGLQLAVRVHGIVTLDGEPLQSAQMIFFAAGVGGGHTARAQSDAEGRFTLDDAREGSYVANILGGSGQFTAAVDIPAVREHEVRIDLHSARIEGRVVDAGGRPVADVQLGAALPGDPNSARSHRGRSREDGTFSLLVEPGTYELLVGGPLLGGEWSGPTVQRIDVPSGGAAEGIEVRVERTGSLEVTLSDGALRLEQGTVRAMNSNGECLHSAQVWSPNGGEAVATFEGLRAGRVLLAGESGELASARLHPVDVVAGKRLALELQLEASTGLEIEVVDAAGKVVPAPIVHVYDADGVQRFASDRDSGVLRFAPTIQVQLPPGSYRVDARVGTSTGSESVTLGGESRRTLRIELP